MEQGVRMQCFWIDKTGFILPLQRSYVREEIGKRCNLIVAALKGRKITAMNPDAGLVYHVILQGGVKAQLSNDSASWSSALLGQPQCWGLSRNAFPVW